MLYIGMQFFGGRGSGGGKAGGGGGGGGSKANKTGGENNRVTGGQLNNMSASERKEAMNNMPVGTKIGFSGRVGLDTQNFTMTKGADGWSGDRMFKDAIVKGSSTAKDAFNHTWNIRINTVRYPKKK